MKEYGILFSAPMVLAIKERRKRVTRRLDRRWLRVKAGDRLWVRETWRPAVAHGCVLNTCDCGDVNITYAADGETRFVADSEIHPEWTIPKAAATGNVSPLFMPRWATRFLLEVHEDAREERLLSITLGEIEAEGFRSMNEFFELWSVLNGPGNSVTNPTVVRIGPFDVIKEESYGSVA